MRARRTTVMILVPGRAALHLDVPVLRPLRAATLAVLVPLLLGVTAQRVLDDGTPTRGYLAMAMGSLHRVEEPTFRRLHRSPQQLRAATTPTGLPVVGHAPPSKSPVGPPPPPESAPSFGQSTLRALMTAVRPAEQPLRAAGLVAPLSAAGLRAVNGAGFSGLDGPDVISVKAILKAISIRRRAPSEREPTAVPINGVLRIQALHLDETLSTRPFDDLLRPDPRAFSDVNHLMRCRVTGHEVEMDPKLVAILSQLSTLYGRTLQLISGHRAPHANGTSPTSQHTLGRAADIRIPGISIAELKRVAIKLGARGVGLYPEKGFVHVDVRDKRYFWAWTARGGEQSDMGGSPLRAARGSTAEPAAEEGGEDSDQGATTPEPESAGTSEKPSAESMPEPVPPPPAAAAPEEPAQ
jgi:uncharacterized protein YcbK (DUF882 family)